MTTSRPCRVLLLAAFVPLLNYARPAEAQTSAAQPNIVLIMVDDAGYNEFGFSNDLVGSSRVSDTPTIDALAAQSTVFSQGYVSAPLCSPSRAAMLTGQYAQRFGWENNPSNDTSSPQGLTAGQLTMGHHLQSLGYTTGLVGKWHLGYQDGLNRPQDMGFDDFYGMTGGGRDYWPWPNAPDRSRMRRGDVDIENSWGSEGDPSLYDPTRGRYLTDALGEESADFINRHAGSDEPFFLYTAITSPHTPIQTKQSDLDHFAATIENEAQRKIAALNYATDRAVGMIMDALVQNEVDDNTVIVFLNDNGAPALNIGQNNSPFSGTKGLMFEGGTRVPFFMRAPGVGAQVYDQPITARDLLPTFYAMAGGDPTQLDVDGVNLTPYLDGQEGAPHEILFWRGTDGRFAVRKGDWKLVRPNEHPFARLNNMAWDPTEKTYYNGNANNGMYQHVVDDLNRELTRWEATLERPKWDDLGALDFNTEDHFVFRNDSAAADWSTAGGWSFGASGEAATLMPQDAYANAVLEFTTNDSGDYTSTNNMRRATRREFMLNQVRFTGEFAGAGDHQATINRSLEIGMVFVNNLSGEGPKIRIDATSTGANNFDFVFDQIAFLLHDLEITGDGTQLLRLTGATTDYDSPTRITKSGASTVVLEGLIDVGTGVTVNGGAIIVDAANAELTTAGDITLTPAGSLELRNGRVRADRLNTAGASFAMTGGVLSADLVNGDLAVSGGVLAPGESIGDTVVSGGLLLDSGATLEIEISAAGGQLSHDRLSVTNTADLRGALQVVGIDGFTAAAGQVFQLALADTIVDGGLQLTGDAGGLELVHISGVFDTLALLDTNALPGDFNGDGAVDAADYTVWRDNLGAVGAPGLPGDGDDGSGFGVRDGVVDEHDLAFWRTWYGLDYQAVSGGQFASVPEPSAAAVLLIAGLLIPRRRG